MPCHEVIRDQLAKARRICARESEKGKLEHVSRCRYSQYSDASALLSRGIWPELM